MSSRRKFLKDVTFLAGGFCIGGAAITGCKSVAYVGYTMQENKLIVKKSEMGDHKFVVIRTKELPAPVYLAKLGEDNYSALLMECTHKQCEVNPVGNLLHCPCHGSEFTNTGKVLNPPAEKDLTKFKVTFDQENIYIQ